MRMTEKGKAPKPDDEKAIADVPAVPWDHAMKMLATGDYDVIGMPRAERGPDQPGAQSPAPGVDPLDGSKEKAEDGQTLTNMTAVAAPTVVDGGLPKSPAPAKVNVTEAPKVTPVPAKA